MYQMDIVIKKYMICTSGSASFNDEGDMIAKGKAIRRNGGENKTASVCNFKLFISNYMLNYLSE